MPISVTHPSFCTYRRLPFGVPLEELCPPGEIHPSLKSLFSQSYENVASKGYPVAEVLSYYQGSLHERLILKEQLVLSKDIRGTNASPGAFLWVIRHFIGLLPTQLMPRSIGNQKFFWWKITKDCRKCLANYATRGKDDCELLHKLVSELLRLPLHNFLLFATLLNLLRMLAVLPEGEPRINKSAAFALVRYFSSSVFVRPFRPGSVTKVDKQYHPLMLYFILKWPQIRRMCIETSNYSFELSCEELHLSYSHPPSCAQYVSKRRTDEFTQTFYQPKFQFQSKQTLIRVVPPSYHDFEFLKDTACQTDNVVVDAEPRAEYEISQKTCCCCVFGSNYEKSPRNEWIKGLTKPEAEPFILEKKVVFVRQPCCCSYSSNHETEVSSVGRSRSTSAASAKSFSCNFERKSPEVDDLICLSLSTNSDVSNKDEHHRDPIGDTQGNAKPYNDTKGFDPVEKEEKRTHNEAIKEKITKMGWSFKTSDNKESLEKLLDDEETDDDSQLPSRPIGWNVCPGSFYMCDFELHQSLNKELKKRLSEMELRNKCDRSAVLSSMDQSQSDKNDSKLSTKLKESRKSLINVTKLKSRLDFLRVFKPKKMRAKKSFSYENVRSGVKYEKMGSASSIL